MYIYYIYILYCIILYIYIIERYSIKADAYKAARFRVQGTIYLRLRTDRFAWTQHLLGTCSTGCCYSAKVDWNLQVRASVQIPTHFSGCLPTYLSIYLFNLSIYLCLSIYVSLSDHAIS